MKLDDILRAFEQQESKLKQQQVYMQEYVEAVQLRIEECEQTVRKYSADLIMDTEEIKRYTRNYIGSYFEQVEGERDNLATLVVTMTEAMLLEQGISSQVMRAEQVKHKMTKDDELLEIIQRSTLDEQI